eukprot:UN30816
MNEHPGSSAKIATFDDAIFAISTDKTSFAIRTNPPANITGVSNLEYSGSYPASRIKIPTTDDFNFSLYAVSEYSINQLNISSRPNIVFSLDVENLSQNPRNISFMFNVPISVEKQTIREFPNGITTRINATSYNDCLN